MIQLLLFFFLGARQSARLGKPTGESRDGSKGESRARRVPPRGYKLRGLYSTVLRKGNARVILWLFYGCSHRHRPH